MAPPVEARFSRPPDGLPWPDNILRRAYCDGPRPLCRRDSGGGVTLAYPYSPNRPFPLVPVFCFACAACVDHQYHLLFSFDCQGEPIFPHNTAPDGDTNPTP